MNLQLSLKKKWFDLTKAGIKTEDYREITPYWCTRLLLHNGQSKNKAFWKTRLEIYYKETIGGVLEDYDDRIGISSKKFDKNIMTLGYPKKTDKDRILEIEHKEIEIRAGKPEWGAKPNKLYFVIKHGDLCQDIQKK